MKRLIVLSYLNYVFSRRVSGNVVWIIGHGRIEYRVFCTTLQSFRKRLSTVETKKRVVLHPGEGGGREHVIKSLLFYTKQFLSEERFDQVQYFEILHGIQ